MEEFLSLFRISYNWLRDLFYYNIEWRSRSKTWYVFITWIRHRDRCNIQEIFIELVFSHITLGCQISSVHLAISWPRLPSEPLKFHISERCFLRSSGLHCSCCWRPLNLTSVFCTWRLWTRWRWETQTESRLCRPTRSEKEKKDILTQT